MKVRVKQLTAAVVLEIAMLPPGAGDDLQLISAVTGLINEVYAVAEEGLWADGTFRTTTQEIGGLTRARQIAVARVGGQIVGCVRVRQLDSGLGEFGMLAVAAGLRGMGVGGELVRFAEEVSREHCYGMQLEMVVPRGWSDPFKEYIAAWYARRGYIPTRIRTIEESCPRLAGSLATPCDVVVYHKDFAEKSLQ